MSKFLDPKATFCIGVYQESPCTLGGVLIFFTPLLVCIPNARAGALGSQESLYSCPVELFVMSDVLYLLSNTVSTSHTLFLEMWLV